MTTWFSYLKSGLARRLPEDKVSFKRNLKNLYPFAARIAGIHDFIESLPDKYDSILGENGVNLSEGQRQRLSIARALVKDPDIIIMDEPSSSLDAATERSIFESLPQVVFEKTLIIAAHREATIKAADKALKISDKGASFE